jgi:hypothetical protein
MAIAMPDKFDQEDLEKYIKQLSLASPNPDLEKIDKQDYSPRLASMGAGVGYINDQDVGTYLKVAGAAAP